MSKQCIICGKEIPKNRKNKDTCSSDCGMEKLHWLLWFQINHMKELITEAKRVYEQETRGT